MARRRGTDPAADLGPDQLGNGLLGLISGMISAMAYLQVTALPFGHGLPLFDDRASWMALAGMASTLGTVLAAASLRNHRAPAESVDPAPES